MGKEWSQKNAIQIRKFKEQGFRLLFHLSVAVWGYFLMRNEPWWLYGDNFEIRNIPSFELPIR